MDRISGRFWVAFLSVSASLIEGRLIYARDLSLNCGRSLSLSWLHVMLHDIPALITAAVKSLCSVYWQQAEQNTPARLPSPSLAPRVKA
jgi:hypothetical protein